MPIESKVNYVPVIAEITGKGQYVILANADGVFYLQDSNGNRTTLALDGGDGSDGEDGWSPVIAVVTDSARRVLQLADWTGGTGTEPASPRYLGASGFVTDIVDGVDIRGATGATGAQGIQGIQGIQGDTGATGATGAAGSTGAAGAQGDKGWAPVFALATDGARRVLQLVDYVGGAGTEPTANLNEYVGAAGYTATIGSAVDVRGATGATGASGAGTGDVSGPGAAVVDDALVLWEGTTGTIIRQAVSGDAGAIRTQISAAAATHTHAQADITDLTTDLAGKQPLDTDLTAIAALTSAANKVPYATGAGTWALADLTAAGRAILDDADASAQRTTLGVAIGSAVQAWDTDLDGIAALTWAAADKYLYTDGSNVKTLGTITSYIRGLLDDTDASTARSTLGAAATSHTHAQSDITSLVADLALKAPLASPTFTGTPLVPTAADATNNTQAASTAYVTTKVAGLSTTYQPLDATLTALASVVTAASKVIYATGSDTFSTTNIFGLQTIWVPAGSMIKRTTLPPADYNVELASNLVMVNGLAFDAAADEFAQFDVRFPKSWNEGTVTAIMHWTAASGSGDVIWGLQGLARSNDDPLDTAFGTAQTATDTLIAANDEHTSAATSAITIGGTPAEADRVIFQVYRDANAAGDTFSADAVLLGVTIFYTDNALTDD